jgi:hypothetical protein
VAALVELARNCARRQEMGRQAREHVEEHYSLERLPAYLGGLYNMVLPTWPHWKVGVTQGTAA